MRNKIILSGFLLAVLLCNTSFSLSSDSELAKIMKHMLSFIKKEKELIQEGKGRQPFPHFIKKMTTAKVTEGKHLSVDHAEYTTQFLTGLDKYYKEEKGDRKEMFNTMVSACVTCHKRECPGPVQTIQQNIIKPAP